MDNSFAVSVTAFELKQLQYWRLNNTSMCRLTVESSPKQWIFIGCWHLLQQNTIKPMHVLETSVYLEPCNYWKAYNSKFRNEMLQCNTLHLVSMRSEIRVLWIHHILQRILHALHKFICPILSCKVSHKSVTNSNTILCCLVCLKITMQCVECKNQYSETLTYSIITSNSDKTGLLKHCVTSFTGQVTKVRIDSLVNWTVS